MLGWRALAKDDRGATAPEYGLIVLVLGLALASAWQPIGAGVANVFGTVSETIAQH